MISRSNLHMENMRGPAMMARHVAEHGRNGDTMMMHVAPEEVKGLASLFPGKMTINPETGMPEAFFLLPMLAGLALGGMAAPSLLGAGAATAAGAGAAGAASTGLGGLLGGLGGYALPLGLMGATGLDMMMSRGGPKKMSEKDKKKESWFDKYDYSSSYNPNTGGWTGGYTSSDDYVPQYNRGGLIRNGRRYADGGPVMGDEDPGFDPMQSGLASLGQGGGRGAARQLDKTIVQQAIMALTGQIPNAEEALSTFLQRFGRAALADLANRLREQSTDTAGTMISGPGDGVSDEVPAQTAQMPARLSNGEFVIPADTVSGLGNGSSDAGARALRNMIKRVREERNGSSASPPAINPVEVMPV